MTVKEIRALSNDDLIIRLCLCMYSETKTAIMNQTKILQELKKRDVISSVGDVINKIF